VGSIGDTAPVLAVPLVALLLALAAIDLRRRIVPNRIVAPAATWAVVAGAVTEPAASTARLAAGAVAFGALLALAWGSHGGIGMGDVKLAGVMGLFLGPAVAPALLAAFLAGSLAGAGVLLRHGAGARKQSLPFVPFLALGGLVGLFWGDDLTAFYL
jgi:leader peptidase (prepilin peptidase) / N-methyltransferase